MRPTALALAAVLSLWPAGCDRPAPDPGPVAEPSEAAVDIGAGDAVLAAFRDDPVAAARDWIGRRVRVTAAVTQVDPNEGDPYLELAGRILVVPTRAESKAFGRLSAGTTVTVEGTVDPPTTGVPPLTLSGAVRVTSGR